MPVEVDASQYTELVKQVRALGDQKLKRSMMARLRKAAAPMGRTIIERGAAHMPARGGFRALLLSTGRSTVTPLTSGVRLNLRSSRSTLRALDRGYLRHPVFARWYRLRDLWAWANTAVPPEAFTTAFAHMSDEARQALVDAMGDISRELGAR